jgi:hypothetical protein
MKVLNLQCAVGHAFEGWFGSEDDYQSQQSRGLLTCPLCGHAQVLRMPSAPRLNLSGAKAPASAAVAAPAVVPPSGGAGVTPERAQAEAVLLQAMRHVLANTEDVGKHFAEEARRMHHGEAEARNIRGEATRSQAMALHEEGIDVLPLPIPDALKGPLQ